ncbi:MAG: efflux RND transporter periplasmic adaptor subunit [Bryobacteraceae bacterium]
MSVGLTKSREVIWIALVFMGIFLAACSPKPKEEAVEAATPVQVAVATQGPVAYVLTANAILTPLNQANVTSKISAPVRRILVNRGGHVRAGQLLAVLESRDLTAASQESEQLYKQAQASYQTMTGATVPEDKTKALADLQSAQQTLEAAKKVYEGRQSLFRQGALAQKLVDDAKVAMVTAQGQYDTAERHLESVQKVSERTQVAGSLAQVDAAKAHYASAEAQLSYAEIRSPINGVVSDRPVYPGEMANSGSAVISIVDISQVIARANIPVKEAAAIQVGRPATILAAGQDLTGKVTVVSPAVDPSTTTVEVWVQAVNTQERLKPGTTVQVSINAEEIKDAIVVPVAALLSSDEGGDKVMVVGADSLAHERKVEVGVRQADQVQIANGLKAGEQVITFGGLGLEDKAKIIVEKSDTEAPDSGKKDDKAAVQTGAGQKSADDKP